MALPDPVMPLSSSRRQHPASRPRSRHGAEPSSSIRRPGVSVLGLLAALTLLVSSARSVAAEDDTYPVQPGDTLGGIAQALGVSVADLRALNNLSDPNRVRAGQLLRVPAAGRSSGAGYRVRPGDTLGSIAEDTGVSLDRLQELNPQLDPQTITTGQRINLRE